MAVDAAAVIAAAAAARDAASEWSDRASLAVLIGVTLELVDLQILVRLLRLETRPHLKELIAVVGLILVVAGLAIEYRAGIQTHKQTEIIEATLNNSTGRALNNASGAETAAHKALTNASSAEGAAQGVRDQIGPLSDQMGAASRRLGALSDSETALNSKLTTSEQDMLSKIETAQARLASLTKETADLEEAESPREMEQFSLSQAIAPFASVPAFLMTDSASGDADFASYLAFALQMGKMRVSSLSRDGLMQVEGIRIQYGIDLKSGWPPASPAHDAARALCVALTEQHLDVSSSGMPIDSGQLWNPAVPTNGIVIRIAKKENFFFANKMLAARGVRPLQTEQESLPHIPGDPYPSCN